MHSGMLAAASPLHPEVSRLDPRNCPLARAGLFNKENDMDDDKFNMSLRKFLKHVGVTSQREIERIVREGNFKQGKLTVKMVLTAAGTDLNHVIEQDIDIG